MGFRKGEGQKSLHLSFRRVETKTPHSQNLIKESIYGQLVVHGCVMVKSVVWETIGKGQTAIT